MISELIESLEVRAHSAPWWDGINFLIRDKGTATGEITMVKRDPCVAVEPSFRMSAQQAQVLMDDLWACGLRPTEGKGSAGALAATQRHLEDMRRLVFEVKK